MPIISQSLINPKPYSPSIVNLIPEPKQEKHHGGWLLRIMGMLVGGFISASTLGGSKIVGTVIRESIAIGVDLGFQAAASEVEGTNLSMTDVGFTLIPSFFVAGATIRSGRTVAKAEKGAAELLQGVSSDYSAFQLQTLNDEAIKVITQRNGAFASRQSLVRAGFTDKQALEELRRAESVFNNAGLKTKNFSQELDFIEQERWIIGRLDESLAPYGISSEKLLSGLSNKGIDIIGIRSTDDLVKTIRSSKQAVEAVKRSTELMELEKALGATLEPSLFTQVFNAQKGYDALKAVNKGLIYLNPNRLIKKVVDEAFDPVKKQFSKHVLDPLEKKTKQKLKVLFHQDPVAKLSTRNGVYPCFSSSWINYLRAIPVGMGQFKVNVIFRKRSQRTVIITPTLSLTEIINWSQSSSPGRIYHDFRIQYGTPKGEIGQGGADGEFLNNVYNLLGYVPNKYIRLGTSLTRNIQNASSGMYIEKWMDFLHDPAEAFTREISEGIAETIGGRFGKAVLGQATGNPHAITNYFKSNVEREVRSRDDEYRKSIRRSRGSLNSIKSFSDIIK